MKMKINLKDFRVQEDEKVKLKKWPTLVKPMYQSKEQYQQLLREQVEELSSLQQLHYASNRYAVLLIFQKAPSYVVPADDKVKARLNISLDHSRRI